MKKLLVVVALFAAFFTSSAHAEVQDCTEITTLPAVITVQGIYCLKHNLVTSITTGNAIEIQTNNVTIDLNGWKLGGSAAGAGTDAIGIYANERKNITVRNGTIRGFYRGIYLDGSTGFGHIIEGIRADGNKFTSLRVKGDNVIVRNNQIINTGDTDNGGIAYGILVTDGRNVLITGNVISGVTETATVYGIRVNDVAVASISGNFIFDLLTAAVRRGIAFQSSANVSILGNRIINEANGSFAIAELTASTGIDCIGNVARGYTTGSDGCDYSADNHVN